MKINNQNVLLTSTKLLENEFNRGHKMFVCEVVLLEEWLHWCNATHHIGPGLEY